MRPLSEASAWRHLLPTVAVAAVFLLWGLATAGSSVPSPGDVFTAMVADRAFLSHQAALTLFEATAGLGLALATAFVTASVFAISPLVRLSLMPLVVASQTVPVLAIGPLLAAVIGEGLFANVVMTAYLCWFPAVVGFTHGFLTVDQNRLALFEVHGANRWQIWVRLRLPEAAPALVAGIRISAGMAVIGAIVAEYGTLVGGIGVAIVRHVRKIDVLPVESFYALVVVAGLAGLAFTAVMYLAARFALCRWLPEGCEAM